MHYLMYTIPFCKANHEVVGEAAFPLEQCREPTTSEVANGIHWRVVCHGLVHRLIFGLVLMAAPLRHDYYPHGTHAASIYSGLHSELIY